MKITDTSNPDYIAYCKLHHQNNEGHFNGAYYYSKEIVENIIPNVKTDRNWDTLGMRFLQTSNHSIVFLHHNIHHETVYRWLRRYKDLVLVCSTPDTYKWAKTVAGCHAVFLPLSVDVDYVKQFQTEKTKDTCYAGNRWSFKKKYEAKIPPSVDFPPKNIPREELLRFIAPYRNVYAIGRCAIEAKILGCNILPFYDPFPDPSYWRVLDNKDAAKILQKKLDRIDRPHDSSHNRINQRPRRRPRYRPRIHQGL